MSIKLKERLGGIYPALLTPYTPDNRIHEESLRALVRLNLEKGVDGFYVGGSSSEAFLLSKEERMRTLEIVRDALGGRAKLIAHVGCISTADAIELGLHAKEQGVDAISAVPPFYFKFSAVEVCKHYWALADAVGLPLIVYNIPHLSGIELSADDMVRLRQNPLVAGIKHTCLNLFQLERMRSCDPELLIFNGFDEMMLGALAMGADGGIGTTYNFMAEKFIAIRRLFREGRMQEAAAIQAQANGMIAGLMKSGGAFTGSKYILEKKYGIPCGGCRPPFHVLDDAQKAQIDRLIELYL